MVQQASANSRAQYASLPEDIEKEVIRRVWPLFCLVVSCDSLRIRLDYPQPAGTAASSPRAAPVTNYLEGQDAENTYAEGIYMGYRYYNRFKVKPAYEFGYGLSYTTFAYSPLKLSTLIFNGKLTATLTVTNIGRIAGRCRTTVPECSSRQARQAGQ